MTNFVRELKHDHHVILEVVAGMSAVADSLEFGKQVDPNILGDLVQFLAVFADHCHHSKEQFLFALLARKADVTTKRELQLLEQEHHSAAQLVRELAKASAVYIENPMVLRHRVVALLRKFVDLYPAHIWKEDYLLFPMAQQTLSEAEQQDMADKFEGVEREIGQDVHVAFEMLAKQLGTVVEYRNSGACPLCSSAA